MSNKSDGIDKLDLLLQIIFYRMRDVVKNMSFIEKVQLFFGTYPLRKYVKLCAYELFDHDKKNVQSFLSDYDILNSGMLIGGFRKTIWFVDIVDAMRQNMEQYYWRNKVFKKERS